MVARTILQAILDREAGKEVEGPEVHVFEVVYQDDSIEHLESDIQPPHAKVLKESIAEHGRLRPCVWVSNSGHSIRMDLVRSIRKLAPDEVRAQLEDATEIDPDERGQQHAIRT